MSLVAIVRPTPLGQCVYYWSEIELLPAWDQMINWRYIMSFSFQDYMVRIQPRISDVCVAFPDRTL